MERIKRKKKKKKKGEEEDEEENEVREKNGGGERKDEETMMTTMVVDAESLVYPAHRASLPSSHPPSPAERFARREPRKHRA